MPRKQTTAGKRARVAARSGEKYTTALRRQNVPVAQLDHRRLVPDPPDFRALRASGLFDRIGGQPAVDALVDALYDGIEADRQLRPVFPRRLDHSRSMQKLFFAEWLGGPATFRDRGGVAGLRQVHDDLPITPVLARRWFGHFRHAVEATVPTAADRTAMLTGARSIATALVNQPEGVDNSAAVAWCGVRARILTRARQLAHRGDGDGLAAALAEAPDLLQPSFAAAIMQSAVLAGRAEIVRMLLDHGVGPDVPFYLPVGVTGLAFERVIYVTPLCAARLKRRPAAESLLIAAGAREDVFTAAFLGEINSLGAMLGADPGLARATDPMTDVLDITPVEHAVAGGRVEAVTLLLDHIDGPQPFVRALRGAAERADVAMVELLLAHGADATQVGAGRWVLHPELAPLLARHGARIDSSGSWIGASCTGNQGRKDDPEYVRALLRHGARATDRRTGVEAVDATALHYAAKAGFLQTIGVLLEHGADPQARDSRGRTPLDWLDQAAPSVSREAVRQLIDRNAVTDRENPRSRAR